MGQRSQAKAEEPFLIVMVMSITYVPQEKRAHTLLKSKRKAELEGK